MDGGRKGKEERKGGKVEKRQKIRKKQGMSEKEKRARQQKKMKGESKKNMQICCSRLSRGKKSERKRVGVGNVRAEGKETQSE